MRLSTLLATLGLVFVMTLALPAQTVRVIFVSGEASLQRPDEAALRSIVKGETVVIGTRIVTGADGRVVLTPMPGVKSIITPNTTLLLESSSETRTSPTETTHQAVLDLKQGAVVSDLQKPEGVSYDYSIRTARGLAGARGTTFTVGINAAGVQTIVVAHGTISINFTDGRQASLALGQLSITQTSGATQSVSKISDLPEADQKIAQNWIETTINAIAAALEAGIELDPAALNNALEAAKSLGITLSPETRANVERALAKARELADALKLIDPLQEVKDETNLQDIQNIVTERERPAGSETSPRDLFRAQLTAEQRAAFDALPTDIQDQLIAINDPAITAVALAPDPRTSLAHTHQDLRTELTAIQQLSPEAVAFIKTLAGPNLANFDYTPDSAEWSPAAFERTLTTWNSLTASEQELIITLGAGEAVMDKSTSYISALLDSLSPQQRAVIEQTGWGASLDDLAAKPTGSNAMYYAAHFLDDAGRAAVKFFGITPEQFQNGYISSLIEAFAAMSDADQRLLRQLGVSDAAIDSSRYYTPTFAALDTSIDFEERLQNALAFYNRLSSEEKSAARALGLGYLFYHYEADEVVNESGATALQRARSLARFYLDHPDLQQALRDSQLFTSSRIFGTSGSLDFDHITETLNTYAALPLRTRHYLSNHHYSFYDLANPDTSSYYSAAYRSLSAINNILTSLSASEFATLLDLDLGRVVFEVGDMGEGVSPFPFIDGSPVDEIKDTIVYYNALGNARKFVLRELGIVGGGNVAVIGADLDGLDRLLIAYGSLPGALRARTERLNEDHAYYTAYGSTEGPTEDRSFFFPRSYRDNSTIYAVSFRSTGDLHIGATRFLRIQGSYDDDTFITGPNKDLFLHASDLIDLNSTTFSTNIRGITMAAATINLNNITFPEGSVASLNSKRGEMHFGSDSLPGRVNFNNVRYGNGDSNVLDAGNFSAETRGNIAVGTLKNPAALPTYTPPPISNDQ